MNPLLGRVDLPHEQSLFTRGSAERNRLKQAFVLVLTLMLTASFFLGLPSSSAYSTDEDSPKSEESFTFVPLATVTVSNEADFDTALQDTTVTAIEVDTNLTLTSLFEGKVVGNKTITSSGGVKTLTRGDDNTGALFTISGAGNSVVEVKNLTIKGASPGIADMGSLVVISSGATLSLQSGATLTGNAATDLTGKGGAVYNAGTLIVGSGSAISNNSVVSAASAYGGGVFSDTGSTITLAGGTISDNLVQAGASSGNVAYGGGICCEGTINATAGLISGNKTQGGNAQGGGIYLASGSSGEIGAIEISENSTIQGGGVYVEQSFTFVGTTIARNEATATDAQFNRGCGGGVFATAKATVVLQDVDILQNIATMYSPKPSSESGFGGGLFVDGSTTVVLAGATTVTQNRAADGGGGFVHADGMLEMKAGGGSSPLISKNNAVGPTDSNTRGNGGGLAVWGALNATAGTISENSASNSGGGIDIKGSATLGKVTVTGNSAQYGGGVVTNASGYLSCAGTSITQNKGQIGGGIINRGTTDLSKSCRVDDNIAKQNQESNNIVNLWESGNSQPILRIQGGLVANDGVLLGSDPKSGSRSDPMQITGPLVGSTIVIEGYGQHTSIDGDTIGLSVGLSVGDVVARGEGYQITQADLAAMRLSPNWTGYTLALVGNEVIVVRSDNPDPPGPDPVPDPPNPDPDPQPTPGPNPDTSDPLVATAGFAGALAVAGLANAAISRRRPDEQD